MAFILMFNTDDVMTLQNLLNKYYNIDEYTLTKYLEDV